MSHDEFTKLYKFLTKKFDNIDQKFESTASRKDMDQILNRLDSIEKQLEISEDERLVINYQLRNLSDWVDKAAIRIKIPFAH